MRPARDTRRILDWPSRPEVDISIQFEWNATVAEITERVRAAMDD
jgi:hypothetical protein